MKTQDTQREINAVNKVLDKYLQPMEPAERQMIELHIKLVAKAAISDYRKQMADMEYQMKDELD